MSERHTILDSITSAFVPIHPEGRKFMPALPWRR